MLQSKIVLDLNNHQNHSNPAGHKLVWRVRDLNQSNNSPRENQTEYNP